ncbi:hypothetical protein ACLG6S_01815 [Thermodesulfobacteriota bacterium B35]
MDTLPLVRCVGVTAPQPSLQDNTADLDRLRAALVHSLDQGLATRPLAIPFAAMGPVAARFREAGFSGLAVLNVLPDRLELADFLAAPPPLLPAMALDLGTTHLEATLLDLQTGSTLARAHTPNRQIEYGADILSRIHFAATGGKAEAGGLTRLQQAVVESINSLAGDLARHADITPQAIRAVSVSGNTTMVHLLLGLDPYHICREPYIPLVNAPDPLAAADIGLAIHPRPRSGCCPARAVISAAISSPVSWPAVWTGWKRPACSSTWAPMPRWSWATGTG